MMPRDLTLKLVLVIAHLMYFRLILCIDSDFYSQLPGVINSLNEFIKQYEWKVSPFGLDLDSQSHQFLKTG
jgi:hypothetical protein